MIIRNTRAYVNHVPIETTMCFDPQKPAEVLFRFDRSDWIFARDLLARGMTDRVGEGDIMIWPSGVRHIEIYLESPTGKCQMSMLRPDVSSFLEKTLSVIPDEDEEWMIMNSLDSWLEKIFRISD